MLGAGGWVHCGHDAAPTWIRIGDR